MVKKKKERGYPEARWLGLPLRGLGNPYTWKGRKRKVHRHRQRGRARVIA